MHAALDQIPQTSKLLRRAAALGVGLATFFLLASVVEPQPSRASDEDLAPVARITPREAEQISGTLLGRQHPRRWPVLGLLEGSDFLVLAYGSPTGPRYTVCTRLGEILAEDLEPGDAYRDFPGLDLPGMRLDPESAPAAEPLMMVDTTN